MQQIKRAWNNQDLANKVILVTGVIMATVCLVMGQGLYGVVFVGLMLAFLAAHSTQRAKRLRRLYGGMYFHMPDPPSGDAAMKQEHGDLRSFLHGVVNLIWPVFAYDLAELASLIIGGYSWATMVPSTIMLILPIVSDVAGIVTAGVRYYRRQSVLALMGLIFSIAALALYYILRVMMQFSLGWLEPAI